MGKLSAGFDARQLKDLKFGGNAPAPEVTYEAKSTTPFLDRTFQLLHRYHFIPYKWEKEEKRLMRCSKFKRYYWIFHVFCISCFNLAFVTVQLLRNFHSIAYDKTGHPNYGEVNIQMFLFILSALYAMFQFNLYQTTDGVADFYDQIKYYRHIMRAQGVKFRNDFLVIHLVTMMIVVCNLGQALAAIVFPHRAQFLYSIVPKQYQSPYLFLAFLFYNTHLTCASVATSLVLVLAVFLYIESMNVGMKSSLVNLERDYENAEGELHKFRMWQLIANRFNDCFAKITVPAIIWCLGMTGVTCGFGSIRFLGRISIIEYMILPPPVLCVQIFLIYLVVPAAKLRQFSRNIRDEIHRLKMGDSGEHRNLRVVLRSFWDIQIVVRNWFSISKLTFIYMSHFIISQTISLLLYL